MARKKKSWEKNDENNIKIEDGVWAVRLSTERWAILVDNYQWGPEGSPFDHNRGVSLADWATAEEAIAAWKTHQD